MMSQLINATDATFADEVLKADLPVLVDFWADWCAPCRMITPIIEAAAEEYAGKLKVVKLDVQNNQEAAVQFQIRSIPALMIFKDGKIVGQHVGALNKNQLAQFIDSHI
ncbi:thioredoxin [Ignatzschineria larvae DSM 13226]|nr:thioredoxin [Ignatzschineria ureiclastica]